MTAGATLSAPIHAELPPRQPTDLSASRVKTLDKCELAYRYQYVDHIPAAASRASSVFGTVVHAGTERWYSDDYTKNDLWPYVEACWWEHLPQDVAIALRHCIRTEEAQDAVAQAVALARPQIKAPRQTKDFMSSSEFKAFEDARDALLAAQTKAEDMAWPQDENAYQAYRRTQVVAQNLQARWQHRPAPLVVEYGFSIPFAGFTIRGYIDQIRADPDPAGEVAVQGLDIKTGKQPLTQMNAFLQAFLYNEATHLEPALPVPDHWTFLLARPNKPQNARIDRERHAKLAERILTNARRRMEAVEAGDYAPQYGMWCSSCDYRALCEAEIGVWEPGTNSLVLGLDKTP